MDRGRFFLKIFIITFLIAGGGFLVMSSNPVLSFVKVPKVDVKGISTHKAQKVTGEIASDIGDGVGVAKEQILNIKIGDILGVVLRLQKIPQDVQNMQQYVKEQVGNVIESKE